MRNPAEIASKIRQVQFEYLKLAYQSELSKKPSNCVYNRTVTLYGEGEVVTRLCGFYSDEKNYIVCDTDECASSCNAFVCRKDKKDVREQIEKDMTENPSKYPEILALEWALGRKQSFSLAQKSWFLSLVERVKIALRRVFP